MTSNPPDTSGTGPFIFGSDANNIFVNDLSTGTTSLITATTGGLLSDSTYPNPLLSPDGRTLYFDSDADNLTADDTNQAMDIFAASAPFATPNQFQFQSWETAATESSGQVIVTVLRTGPATGAASVDYSVQNGTAQAGTDFTATSGTLNFAAGQTAQTFTVPLATGDDFDGTRSAQLVLSNPAGASLGFPSAELDLTANPASTPTPTPTATSTPTATPTSTPTATPKSTATSTPTPTSTSTPKSTTATEPGPTITSVVPVKGRGGIRELVITFDQALDPAAAANVANYGVSVPRPRHGKHRTAVAARTAVGVASATYNAAEHQVTLTLHAKLHGTQAIQVQLKGM